MAKKAAPAKSKSKKAPAPASAVKKAAAKPASKQMKAVAKSPLKSAAKKDVKTPAGSKASGKSGAMAKAVVAAKANVGKAAATAAAAKNGKAPATNGKAVELKVKGKKGGPLAADKSIPMTKAQLAKAAKIAKAQAAAARALEDACREIGCESVSSTAGYCRLHYIKNWKKIKRKELILREKKLNQYIEELVAKYPDKYIEAIKQDLSDEKAFSKVIYDLELDEGVDEVPADEDSDDNIVESIKRDFDDGDADF